VTSEITHIALILRRLRPAIYPCCGSDNSLIDSPSQAPSGGMATSVLYHVGWTQSYVQATFSISYLYVAKVAVIKLRASRPRKDFTLHPHPPYCAGLWQQYSIARFATLFWAVFTRLGSTIRVAKLYDFAVALKHTILWRLLKLLMQPYILFVFDLVDISRCCLQLFKAQWQFICTAYF
jgi:hypothetical protein